MIRKLLSIVLAMVIVSCFAVSTGCNSKTEKTKVVIWHSSGEKQNEALDDIVKRFNDSHPNIEVVAESQPSANFMNNVYSAVANGVGPDIIFNFASTASDFIAEGKLVNLSEYFDLNELKSIVPKAVFDECTSFEGGGLYCLPLHSSGPVLFYNKAIYDELELIAPNTWEQLTANAKTIFETKGIPGFAADSLTDLMQCQILQRGEGYIDVDAKKILFNTDSMLESLEWYGSNVRAGYFTNEKDGSYFYNNLNSGLVAAIIASCGCEEYITIPDYAVAPIPQIGDEEWVPSWNRALMVFTSNKTQEAAAVEFLKFFTNAENSAQWCIASGNISPYSYTASVPEYQEFLTKNKALAVVNNCKEKSTMLPTIAGASTVRSELERLATVAISSDTNLVEELSNSEKICNDALNGK